MARLVSFGEMFYVVEAKFEYRCGYMRKLLPLLLFVYVTTCSESLKVLVKIYHPTCLAQLQSGTLGITCVLSTPYYRWQHLPCLYDFRWPPPTMCNMFFVTEKCAKQEISAVFTSKPRHIFHQTKVKAALKSDIS